MVVGLVVFFFSSNADVEEPFLDFKSESEKWIHRGVFLCFNVSEVGWLRIFDGVKDGK